MSWVWLAAQAAVIGAAAWWCRSRRRPGPVLGAFAATSCTGLVLSAVLGESAFGILRLMALTVFVHGPVWCALGAGMLWRDHRRWAVTGALGAAVILGVGIDAFWIEPYRLEVTRHTFPSAKVQTPFRIVVFADLQTDHIGDYERAAFEQAAAAKPDLVLLPGDYLQVFTRAELEREGAKLRALLNGLDWAPRLGIIAVGGDVERGRDWSPLFAGTAVRCLVTRETVAHPEVWVTGITLEESRDRTLQFTGGQALHIVMGHRPDFSLGGAGGDLLVAGHTHGGQVQVPFLGPPITLSDVPRRHAAGGLHQLADGRHLCISRGVGMEQLHAPRLRFNCRPELVVIDVVPATK